MGSPASYREDPIEDIETVSQAYLFIRREDFTDDLIGL